MKNAALLFLLLILSSCNFFEAKKISSEEILNDTFEKELQRVIVHGLLHLSGYKASTVEERIID